MQTSLRLALSALLLICGCNEGFPNTSEFHEARLESGKLVLTCSYYDSHYPKRLIVVTGNPMSQPVLGKPYWPFELEGLGIDSSSLSPYTKNYEQVFRALAPRYDRKHHKISLTVSKEFESAVSVQDSLIVVQCAYERGTRWTFLELLNDAGPKE
jgi:hypothetical protein